MTETVRNNFIAAFALAALAGVVALVIYVDTEEARMMQDAKTRPDSSSSRC